MTRKKARGKREQIKSKFDAFQIAKTILDHDQRECRHYSEVSERSIDEQVDSTCTPADRPLACSPARTPHTRRLRAGGRVERTGGRTTGEQAHASGLRPRPL